MKSKLLLALVFLGNAMLFGQTGGLKGRIIDEETREELPFANVQLSRNGDVIANAITDIEGNFAFLGLEEGLYEMKAAYVGYEILQSRGIIILPEKITQELVVMKSAAIIMCPIVICEFTIPCMADYATACGGEFSCYGRTGCYFVDGLRICSCFIDESIFADTSKVEERIKPEVTSKISPNPFMDRATLEILSGTGIEEGSVQLFDLTGSLVRSINFSGNNVSIERNDLAAGTYMYQVCSKEKPVASGRIIVQ